MLLFHVVFAVLTAGSVRVYYTGRYAQDSRVGQRRLRCSRVLSAYLSTFDRAKVAPNISDEVACHPRVCMSLIDIIASHLQHP